MIEEEIQHLAANLKRGRIIRNLDLRCAVRAAIAASISEWRQGMRRLLIVTLAVAIAAGGLAAAGIFVPAFESPALAQKAKATKKPRRQRSAVPQTTGFEHQQCSVQNPCSTRNQW